MITIVVEPTVSRIKGDISDKHFALLRHVISYTNPKYQGAKAFGGEKARFTKERVTLIDARGKKFSSGLLSRVMEACDSIGIPYEIDDRREDTGPEHFMPLAITSTMRNYQQRAIDIAIEKKYGVIRMGTGGGKTRVMAGIVAALERRAVIIVHRIDLMIQVLETLHELLQFSEVIGQVGNGVYEPNVITVATVQTTCAALGVEVEDADDDGEKPRGARAHEKEILEMLTSAQVVVIDECHHTPAKTISHVLGLCHNATWRIGLSATDWRDDGLDLLIEAATGPRLIDISLSDLINLGWLVPPKIMMVPMKTSGPKCTSKVWTSVQRHYYTENDAFHEQVLRVNAAWYKEGRSILTLVYAVEHGETLLALHEAAGIPTTLLCGKDTPVRRKEVFDQIKAGKLRHLIGTSIADEGLDLPILDALNLACGGKSTTKAYQRIGRVLRTFGEKQDAVVMDYRCYEHDALKKHAGRRANIYKKEPRFDFQEQKHDLHVKGRKSYSYGGWGKCKARSSDEDDG